MVLTKFIRFSRDSFVFPVAAEISVSLSISSGHEAPIGDGVRGFGKFKIHIHPRLSSMRSPSGVGGRKASTNMTPDATSRLGCFVTIVGLFRFVRFFHFVFLIFSVRSFLHFSVSSIFSAFSFRY